MDMPYRRFPSPLATVHRRIQGGAARHNPNRALVLRTRVILLPSTTEGVSGRSQHLASVRLIRIEDLSSPTVPRTGNRLDPRTRCRPARRLAPRSSPRGHPSGTPRRGKGDSGRRAVPPTPRRRGSHSPIAGRRLALPPTARRRSRPPPHPSRRRWGKPGKAGRAIFRQITSGRGRSTNRATPKCNPAAQHATPMIATAKRCRLSRTNRQAIARTTQTKVQRLPSAAIAATTESSRGRFSEPKKYRMPLS